MIASAILLDAYVALWTVLGVGRDVICRFTIIGTLCQPSPDGQAVGWRMIVAAALKTKRRIAGLARCLLCTILSTSHDHLTILAGAETQLGMRFDVVLKSKLLILITNIWTRYQIEHEIFWYINITIGGHTTNLSGDSLRDLNLEVHRPAVLAERVCTREIVKLFGRVRLHTHRT